MTLLSRGTILGCGKETTPGTYVVPTFSIPWTKASYETVYDPLRDESVRGDDAVLHGLYQGPGMSTWDLELPAYPDILGHFLGMIGADTVSGGVSTAISASTIAGATSITTAATIPAGSTIKIGSGATLEYAVTGTPTGVGPFTIPIATPATGLLYAHATSDPVVAQYTHTFAQSAPATRPPAYSFTTNEGVDTRGWPGCAMSELAVKVDPKGICTINPKYTGFPEASQSSFAYAASLVDPLLGWEWTITNAGGASTRGLSLDWTFKRQVEAIASSDGTLNPREVFAGALELDGSYKAIFENTTDYLLFLNATQSPLVATLTKPYSRGGELLALTLSQSGWHKGARDLGETYVQAGFDVSAIYNATDAGICKAVLKNYRATAF